MKLIKELENINEVLELEVLASEDSLKDTCISYITEKFVYKGEVYREYCEAKEDCTVWIGFKNYKFKKGDRFLLDGDGYVERIGGINE